ncbi:unnamed protein product, partial [Symbiodinium sp. KB8]
MEVIRYMLLSLDTLFDNFVVVYMCMDNRKSAWRAVVISLLFSLGYLTFALLIPSHPDPNCPWCGVHFPKAEILYPYFVAAAMYLTIFFISLKRQPCKTVFVRPAVTWWCAHLTFYYFFSSIGLWLVTQVEVDFGFCLVDLALLEYVLVYAGLLYFVFVKDTKYCLFLDTNRVLSSLNLPLISAEMSKHFRALRRRARKAEHASRRKGQSDSVDQRLLAGRSQAGYTTFDVNDMEAKNTLPEQVQALLEDTSISFIRANELTPVRRLGVGAFGSVYLKRWRGVFVAVKQMNGLSMLVNGEGLPPHSDDESQGEDKAGSPGTSEEVKTLEMVRVEGPKDSLSGSEGEGNGRSKREGRPPRPPRAHDSAAKSTKRSRKNKLKESRRIRKQRQQEIEQRRRQALQEFLYEARVLSRLRHPNILTFLGVCIEPEQECIVTEYMTHGSVYNLIHSDVELD